MTTTPPLAGTPGLTPATPAPHDSDRPSAQPASPTGLRRVVQSVWSALVAAVAVVVGLAPHVLHHVGLIAGTALVVGAGGTALFAVIGLLASIPMLLRLKRRFRSWWAPAIGLAVFTGMFLLSTLVIGPAITGRADTPAPASPTAPTVQVPAEDPGHAGHHPAP